MPCSTVSGLLEQSCDFKPSISGGGRQQKYTRADKGLCRDGQNHHVAPLAMNILTNISQGKIPFLENKLVLKQAACGWRRRRWICGRASARARLHRPHVNTPSRGPWPWILYRRPTGQPWAGESSQILLSDSVKMTGPVSSTSWQVNANIDRHGNNEMRSICRPGLPAAVYSEAERKHSETSLFYNNTPCHHESCEYSESLKREGILADVA